MADKTTAQMPAATIETLARSVFEQARGYGFTQLDQVRLASALLSLCNVRAPEAGRAAAAGAAHEAEIEPGPAPAPVRAGMPIRTARLVIETLGSGDSRCAIAAAWLQELFAAHFLLAAATAQPRDLHHLLSCERNRFGFFSLHAGRPVGLIAFLDHDELHHRAEVRILIGDAGMRQQGYADEALRAWLGYGFGTLGLEKVFTQVLAGDVRSLRVFERLGFAIEAVLPGELCVAGHRQDAVRCSLLREPVISTGSAADAAGGE